MAVRKGFVYTLEAVIASTIMLGMALFLIPSTVPDPEPDFETVRTGLQSLDDREKIGDNRQEIENNIDSYVPEGYNTSVILTSKSEELGQTVSGGESFYLASGYKNLFLWIESADELEATYRGSTILDTNETGYEEITLDNQPGYLNFTGTTNLDLRVDKYQTSGTIPTTDSVYSTNYIDVSNNTREIRVIVWE